MPSPSYAAGGTVRVGRVVKAGASSEGAAVVTECGVSDQPVGVSQDGSRDAPGLTGSTVANAALIGEGLRVYGLGEICRVLIASAGLAITAGQRVKVVTSGGEVGPVGAGQQSGQWTVGIALESRQPGEFVRIQVDPMQVAIPQS